MEELKAKAERLARDAGMQWDARYSHWVSPRGKFESEPWYAPYYWDAMTLGDGQTIYGDWSDDDEDGPCATLFTVDGEESEAFGIDCGRVVMLRECSQGFVYVTDHADDAEATDLFQRWYNG